MNEGFEMLDETIVESSPYQQIERLVEDLVTLANVGNANHFSSELAEQVEDLAWRPVYSIRKPLPTKANKAGQKAELSVRLAYMPYSCVAKLHISVLERVPAVLMSDWIYEDKTSEVFFADNPLQAVFKAQDFAYAALRRYVEYKRTDLPLLTEHHVFKIMQGHDHSYVHQEAIPAKTSEE